MNRIFQLTFAAIAAAVFLSFVILGCAKEVTAENAAPNTKSEDREAMIKWHKEHDKK